MKIRNKRSYKFFKDILPPEAFDKRKGDLAARRETEEICRILSKECGIHNKKLAIRGEGEVTG